MPNDTKEITVELWKMLVGGCFGAVGGWAMYLNGVRKGRAFKIGAFLVNGALAAFVGYLCNGLLPNDLGDVRYSVIALSGFLSYPILDLVEEKGIDFIIKRIVGKSK